jgi:glycosyltransferase involved in cell wall biosynthesis
MKKKTKVLRIIARMNIGGPAFQISELLDNLNCKDFEHRLILGKCISPEKEIETLDIHQEKLIRLNSLGRNLHFFSDLMAFIEIRRIMVSWQPEIVHTHTAKAGFLGRLAAMSVRPRPRLVHTFHGHLLEGYFSRQGTKLVTQVERLLARRSDKLIAVGQQIVNDLLSVGIGEREKYEVIQPGIRRREDNSLLKLPSNFQFLKNYTYIVWIGRLVHIKHPMLVLDLAQSIKVRYPSAHFIMVGDGDLRGQLEDRIASEKLPVTLLGWQTNITSILDFASLVIQTSLNEGTPLAIIQAQAAGVPVITTNVGSISEIIEDGSTGDLVEGNVAAFTTAISKYMEDEGLRIQVGLRAKEKSDNSNSPEKFLLKHEVIYREITK